MSDLQRLFWRTPTALVTPLEDFSTEALAIAIRHDLTPFLRALQAVPHWTDVWGQPPDLMGASLVSADTQRYLYHEGLESGRLDLVLVLETVGRSTRTVWVEVKIDAPIGVRASGSAVRDQLGVYLDHIGVADAPKPVLLTLTKSGPLRDDVIGITWADLAAAVQATPDADERWVDLIAFLNENLVVLPPLPHGPIDVEAVLPVFRAVNKTVKELWHDAPSNLHTIRVDHQTRWNYAENHSILLTAGPLSYGVRPTDQGWEWWVTVAAGSDYQRVWIDPEAVRRAAEVRHLPDRWSRSTDRRVVLTVSRPLVALESMTQPALWIEQAIRELHYACVLDPWIEAWSAKLDLERRRRAEKALERQHLQTADA